MRTTQEIIARIEARKAEDVFGFEWPYYLYGLTFEQAKPYLKDDVTGEGWQIKTDEEIRKQAIAYMEFAWDKANNCRWISASRSISHYQAWLWMLGIDWCDSLWDDYEFYGKPQLVRICEYFGLDHKKWDNGVRTND